MNSPIFMLAILVFLNISGCYAQNEHLHLDNQIGYKQIEEYFALYLSEQHEVIASKMSDAGYKIDQYIPGFSLGKKEYSGEYRFVKKVSFGLLVVSNYWKFKTVKYSDILTEYLIEFDISASNTKNLIEVLSQDYFENKGFDSYNCYSSDTCVRVGSIKKHYCIADPSYAPELELNPVSYHIWTMKTTGKDGIEYPAGENEEIFMLDMSLGKEFERKRDLNGYYYVRKLHNKISNWEEYKKNYNLKSVEYRVPFKRQGNIYTISIQIGGKSLEYIIDSGASDLVITEITEQYLRSIGALRDSDYQKPQSYKLADGSIKTYRRVIVPTVMLGNNTVAYVMASINPDPAAPLLLGKSFLDKLTYWKINNETGYLEFKIK